MSDREAELEYWRAEEQAARDRIEVLRQMEADVQRVIDDVAFQLDQSILSNTDGAHYLQDDSAAIFAYQAGEAVERLVDEIAQVSEGLEGALDFTQAQSFPLPDLLGKLSEFLLNPTYVPGEPCLAPAPLLRDLLDMALGKVVGGIDALIGKVAQSAWDLLLPAGVEGDDLTRFVESILADPVTAALNFVLGKRSQIDCVVTGGLGVGQRVIETVIERLEGALTEALA